MNKLHLLTSLFLITFIIACVSDNNAADNCNHFRRGKFIVQVDEQKYFEIERNDSIQTEILYPDNDYYKLAVNWLSDCKFEIKAIDVPNLKQVEDEFTLTVEIESTIDDTMFYMTYPKGQKEKGLIQHSKMIKIK